MRLVKAAQLFKALADRTRLRMLFLLKANDLTGTELADILRVPRGRITRHLAYLHKSRQVSVRHERNEAYYYVREGTEKLDEVLSDAVIPLLRTVDGMARDMARCRKALGRARRKPEA